MSFDAGALLFKLQTVGAQAFKQDQADAEQAVAKTGRAAQKSAGDVDKLGQSTDASGQKARGAKGPLNEQAKATEDVGEQSRKATPKQQEQAQASEAQAESAKKLSVALAAAGAAVAALVTLAVAKSADFDQAMSNVRAATMATAAEQRELSESALEAGADTAYSAREAADAQEELAKAGLSVSEIVGGSLNGALALAAAGQLQVARSAEIMATTLKQFKLPAEQASHVSDLLAAGAGKAQGSVDDLALALQYVGPVASGLNLSLEETTGTLALFASQGQLGERAGTGLRGVLMSLTAPSAIAAKTMAEYNVEIFDSNGKMKSLAAVSQELKNAFGGLTEAERSAALGRIFGNEQITAARVLYEGGAEAVQKWTKEVDESGYAARQAAMRQDNLAGDIEKLGGAFDTALIRSGSAANDVLRSMVQGLTQLVDMYGEAPAPIQATATVLGIAAAAMLLFAGGAVGARAKFLELKAQLDATNISMGKTALIGGAVGLALTGVITVVGLLMAAQAEARAKAEAYADTLEAGTNRITSATRDMVKENLSMRGQYFWWENPSAYDTAEALGVSLDLVTDAATGNAKALRELDAELKALRPKDAFADSAEMEAYENRVKTITDAVKGESGSIEEAIRRAEQKQAADKDSADTSENAADAYIAEAKTVEDLSSKLSKLIDTINAANGVGQDAITTNIDYQNALAKVDEVIQNARAGAEGYALTLDTNTQAGRDNMDMLVGLARDAADAAQAQFTLDGSVDGYRQRLEGSRQALLDRIHELGLQGAEAEALADKILRIPSESEWRMIAQTQEAQSEIDRFVELNNGKTLMLHAGLSIEDPAGRFADGGVVRGYANGGIRFNAAGNVYRPENHVAQIARAGEYRVWAEPETGGESYIPHAPSKRTRSEQLMGETASILGGTYIPSTARIEQPAPAGGGAITVVLESKGGIDLLRYVDVRVEQGVQGVRSEFRGA